MFTAPPVEGENIGPEDFKDRKTFRHMIVAGACMSDHAKYVRLRKAGDKRPALLILSPEGVSTSQKGGDRPFADLLGFGFKADAAYYVTLKLEGGRARHAIGIRGTHEHGFTFFDPNAGEYEVSGFQFDRFLSAYRQILIEKLRFGDVDAIVISKGKLAPA